jgi:GAF domain-containing protein
MPVAKASVADEKDKPVYDEQTLAKLLEAAYVLQEHNRELRQREVNLELQRDQLGAQERAAAAKQGAPASPHSTEPAAADYTQTLAQIVETQRQIQARNLQLQAAMELVASRVTEIANAGGAAIGILNAKTVRYRVVSGEMTLQAGSEVAMETALCIASLRTGQVIRCADVNSEFLLDVEECHRRGIHSMIAVPIYHDGGIAGGLELYYAAAQAFTEHDVHSCQLMAGLVTEALVREDEIATQRSLAEQRAAMRETLEKLKPTVAALANRVANNTPGTAAAAAPQTNIFVCRKCGHQLMGEEQFCGNCGTPRSGEYGPPNLQSKVASLWHMQEAMTKNPASSSENGESETAQHASPTSVETPHVEPVATNLRLDELRVGDPRVDAAVNEPSTLATEPMPFRVPIAIPDEPIPLLALPADAALEPHATLEHEEEHGDRHANEVALAVADQPWSSAAAARNYLEELVGAKRSSSLVRFWNDRRGDIYLVVAVIVVAIVIRWGIWSSHSVSATGNSPAAAAHHKADPNADLSWFDRMMISLGLAEAPPPPESKGNPDTQVWVDLHTALYYCPGTDLYGKTPKGKYTSQRDAQLDSFEPAAGRPCD